MKKSLLSALSILPALALSACGSGVTVSVNKYTKTLKLAPVVTGMVNSASGLKADKAPSTAVSPATEVYNGLFKGQTVANLSVQGLVAAIDADVAKIESGLTAAPACLTSSTKVAAAAVTAVTLPNGENLPSVDITCKAQDGNDVTSSDLMYFSGSDAASTVVKFKKQGTYAAGDIVFYMYNADNKKGDFTAYAFVASEATVASSTPFTFLRLQYTSASNTLDTVTYNTKAPTASGTYLGCGSEVLVDAKNKFLGVYGFYTATGNSCAATAAAFKYFEPATLAEAKKAPTTAPTAFAKLKAGLPSETNGTKVEDLLVIKNNTNSKATTSLLDQITAVTGLTFK